MRYRKKPVVIEAFQMTKERRWDHQWPMSFGPLVNFSVIGKAK